MTVTTTYSPVTSTGNGVTTLFPVPFQFYVSSDLVVYLDGVEQASGYTVTGGAGSTGNVTFSTAPANGVVVTIELDLPFTQQDDYVEGQAFPAETLERGFDRAALRDQQLSSKLDRALRFPPTVAPDIIGFLPQPEDGKYLAWQGTDGTVVNADISDVEKFKGTSTTSNSIGTGSKTFTTQTGKDFVAGRHVLITSDADPVNRRMSGVVTSYSSTTLIVSVETSTGSGTYTDWTIRIDGERGATGATGPSGGVNNIDFSLITTDNSPDAGSDEFLFNVGGALRKTNFDNMLKIIDGLAVETTVTLANDKFPFFDASANSPRAITGTNLATALGGSGWVPIKTVTASASATVDFVNGSGGVVLDGTYKMYVIVGTSIKLATESLFYIRTSSNAGSSYDAGATDYDYSSIKNASNDADIVVSNSSGAAQIRIGPDNIGNDTGESLSFIAYVCNPSSTNYTKIYGMAEHNDVSGNFINISFGGQRVSAADVDALRFLASSGNITSGTFTLYGIKDA